jgi:peptidoglycan hydrolase-like protein with peptidoglycan-binding domain
VYGPRTALTVERFQARHHLYADGIVGPRTWRAVGAQDRAVARAHLAAERAAAVRYARARAAAARRATLARYGHLVLRKGARGAAVRYVQRRVGVGADGDYGRHTRTAVMAFQRRHHLIADGVVGRRTWRALVG